MIGLAPVASLVYSNGKHLISVMQMPSAQPLAVPLEKHVEQGYQALTWSDGKITYWAVSDAAAEELKTFVSLFQAAADPEFTQTPSEPIVVRGTPLPGEIMSALGH